MEDLKKSRTPEGCPARQPAELITERKEILKQIVDQHMLEATETADNIEAPVMSADPDAEAASGSGE